MARLLNQFKKHFDLIFLSLILLFIFIQNYSPGTYLVGWDNLMPELNIGMNIKRSLLAVWQEYQGLGLVGGMGHATEIIRQLILLPLTFIIPHDLIRYLWHFFTIALGTFGIYFGLKKHFHFNRYICFFSSLFYLLNFGTVQNYWAPFEPFSAFWGFFPWLMFSLWETLKKPDKKNLLKFTLLNFFAIPSFYVQTVFIVYLISIGPVILIHLISSLKNWQSNLAHSFKMLAILFCINAFWLLPFAYFLKDGIQNPTNGFGNLMSSEETFMRNQNRGGLLDFLLLRGYYYDFPDSGGFLMTAWRNHLSNPLVVFTGLFLSLISVYGIIRLIFAPKKLNLETKSLLVLFFICATALLSTTPPFSFLNYLIRQTSLLNQVFRSPFTKFIVPTTFSFALLFAFGLNYLKPLIQKIKSEYLHKFVYALIPLFLLIFSFPSFTGNFIYPQIRQKIPQEYFNLINFFKTRPSTDRIMNLPSGNYWGWTSYRYGIRGSGFIWYGIENPILDRAFDVWNLKNEQYYWELNFALQKQDPQLLKNIINKYSVSYLIFDNNIYFPSDPIYGQLSTPTRLMLSQMDNLTLDAQFGNIYIYRVKNQSTVSEISNLPDISEPGFFYTDTVYNTLNNFQTSSSPQIIYPFTDLFTSRLQKDLPFQIDINNNQIDITKPLAQNAAYSISTPLSSFSAILNPSGITASIPITKIINSDLNSATQPLISENGQKFIRLKTSTPNDLFVQYFPEVTYDQSYLIKIDYRHLANYPLTVSAYSEADRHIFFNTKLEPTKDWTTAWFIIPQYDPDSFNNGLTIMFNNTTLNGATSINDIKDIKIYPIPYNDLVSTQIISSPTSQSNPPVPLDFSSSIFFYKVKNISNVPDTLILPQTYDRGWIAYYFKGLRPIILKNHVLVNNWENGWQLNSNAAATIYLLFWPQVLEFIGFGFLLLVPLIISTKKLDF